MPAWLMCEVKDAIKGRKAFLFLFFIKGNGSLAQKRRTKRTQTIVKEM